MFQEKINMKCLVKAEPIHWMTEESFCHNFEVLFELKGKEYIAKMAYFIAPSKKWMLTEVVNQQKEKEEITSLFFDVDNAMEQFKAFILYCLGGNLPRSVEGHEQTINAEPIEVRAIIQYLYNKEPLFVEFWDHKQIIFSDKHFNKYRLIIWGHFKDKSAYSIYEYDSTKEKFVRKKTSITDCFDSNKLKSLVAAVKESHGEKK